MAVGRGVEADAAISIPIRHWVHRDGAAAGDVGAAAGAGEDLGQAVSVDGGGDLKVELFVRHGRILNTGSAIRLLLGFCCHQNANGIFV